ncbi:hypothetical protein K490DRAFT_71400 [Saccharata proteae CBS 121410]|uniref:Pre-rRNA-processing protein n=1 Tax=Saccharata proteae CBS 121410 TaxID=1314787 RepID=A0A9P4I0B4_9PEZI|nr:hypothetical protein K490DRAFT_71400 [Saccharata proteae CBS 121410]
MGSSAKRKKEKQKDFQKPKLKVGKAKPKAANFTDTSFKAKSIVVTQQSLSVAAPSSTSTFSHNLSLLTHKSDTQRKDSLSHLTTAVSSARAHNEPLPMPTSVIIPKMLHLIYDNSNGVRQQLLKFLQTLPSADVAAHAEELLRRTRAGMTSLSTDIRMSSLEILDWLLRTAPSSTVGCAGGWIHTLKCLTSLLGWKDPSANSSFQKWSTTAYAGSTSSKDTDKLKKLRVKQLSSLAAFLKAGLVQHAEASEEAQHALAVSASSWFPLHHGYLHAANNQPPNALAHLNLFGAQRDEDAEMYADREGRQRAYAKLIRPAVDVGLVASKREGGVVGRAAGDVEKTLIDGMGDYEAGDY